MAIITITQQTMDSVGGAIGHDTDTYSGRGMYGDQCLSITVDQYTSLWDISGDTRDALEDADDDERPVIEYMVNHPPRQDSMGLGTVLYWPSIKVEG